MTSISHPSKTYSGLGLLVRHRMFTNEQYDAQITADMEDPTPPTTEAQKQWRALLAHERAFLAANRKRLQAIADLVEESKSGKPAKRQKSDNREPAEVASAENNPVSKPDSVIATTSDSKSAQEAEAAFKAKAKERRDKDYILYFDGASKNNPGESGAGWIIFHADGAKVARFGYDYMGLDHTNNEAEYTALLNGLEAVPTNCRKLTVHGDSTLVIKQTFGGWKCGAPNLVPLCAKAKAKIETLKESCAVVADWVGRNDNTFADKLSNMAIQRKAHLKVYNVDKVLDLKYFNTI